MYAGILSPDTIYKKVSFKKAFICISKYDTWGLILFIEILRLNEMYRVVLLEPLMQEGIKL